MDDNFHTIRAELESLGGRQKSSGDTRFICCPFPEHGGEDKTPSLGIYMAVGQKIPLGFCHCFGCGSKGPWNTLAKLLNLKQIKGWSKPSTIMDLPSDLEDELLGDSGLSFKSVLERMGHAEAMLWPSSVQWRGFDGALLRKVGGHMIDDTRNDNIGIIFPIKVGGKVRGGVKAVYERKDRQLAYVTMKGPWVADYGLFPYMLAAEIKRKAGINFIVLVEGPRDALRLCALGIPAIAILGATSMSKKKAQYVLGLDVERVYVLPDTDDGGKTMWATVRKIMKNEIPLTRLRLPVVLDKKGRPTKMDPCNAPIEVIKALMEVLSERSGFVAPKRIDFNLV